MPLFVRPVVAIEPGLRVAHSSVTSTGILLCYLSATTRIAGGQYPRTQNQNEPLTSGRSSYHRGPRRVEACRIFDSVQIWSRQPVPCSRKGLTSNRLYFLSNSSDRKPKGTACLSLPQCHHETTTRLLAVIDYPVYFISVLFPEDDDTGEPIAPTT